MALTGAFGLSQPAPTEGMTAYDALNAIGSAISGGDRDDEDEWPKGFINILVFDKDYNLVDFAYDQLDDGHVQVDSIKAPHQLLTAESVVRQAGYAYVFLSNEEPNELQIGFDDMSVKHAHGKVLQQDEYYPFGLTFNSYNRENSVPNNCKFNGIEEVDDLGSNVLDARFRVGDPTIGRWWQIDPKINNYYDVTPYNMMGNNPVNLTDLLGDEWVDKKKDAERAASISAGLDKANAKLEKQNANLQAKIDKANEKGNTTKAEALEQKQLKNSEAMLINSNSKTMLAKMETSNVKFTFEMKASGDKGQTEIRGDVVVISALKNSFGNQVHEVQHAADIGITRNRDGLENYELRAYKSQMAADPSSMPPSDFAPTPTNTSEVTGSYIGGIMDTKADGTTTPTYPSINKKYKKTP